MPTEREDHIYHVVNSLVSICDHGPSVGPDLEVGPPDSQ